MERKSCLAGAAKTSSLRYRRAFCQLSVSERVRAGDPDREIAIEITGSPVDVGAEAVDVEVLAEAEIQ